jgi:hypothetical protein
MDKAMDPKITVRSYFGGCPKCGRSDGLYNQCDVHWFVCHTHKVRWTIGRNILSGWHDEAAQEQCERWTVVADYKDIKDAYLPEGVWSRDRAAREKEMDEKRRHAAEEDLAEDPSNRAQVENRDRVASVILEALRKLGPEAPEAGPVEVLVDDFAKITFAKEGVSMEQVFPF